MNRVKVERRLAWTAVVCGVLLFVLETYAGLLAGEPLQGVIIDYIAAGLLLYAGLRSLRSEQGAAGLLFGAWCYSLCDLYRALMWRTEHYLGLEVVESMQEPFAVFVILILATPVVIMSFTVGMVLVHPKRPA